MLLSCVMLPPVANAEQASSTPGRLAVVESYPPAIGNLVPLYGIFDLARLTASYASDADKLPVIQNRFKQIADSDLDAYRFLSTQYISQIKYADPDEKVVNFDKAGRYKACDEAMKAVASTKKLLEEKDVSTEALQRSVSEIGRNLGAFFSLVPEEDRKRAAELASELRSRDVDKNGRLSDEELQTLGAGQRPLTEEETELLASLSRLGLRNLFVP